MSNGFKGKMKEHVLTMQHARDNSKKSRDLTLRQYVQELSKGQLSEGHVWAELGFDPATNSLNDLLSDADGAWLASEVIRSQIRRGMGLQARDDMFAFERAYRALASQGPVLSEGNGGARYIAPEVIMPPTMRGLVQGAYYQDLVIREISVPQPKVTMPLMNLSEAALVESAEGATIEQGSVSYGSKDITVKKRAKGILFTDESILFNTVNLVSLFFEDFGRLLSSGLNGDAVNVLVNGDQADGSEAAAVIGTETGTSIDYLDVLRVAIRFGLIGRKAIAVIGNETTTLSYLNLDAVKNRLNLGPALLPTILKTPLPIPDEVFAAFKVPADELVIADTSAALVQLTAKPLMLESERIARKQINGTFASIYTGFANVQRNARVRVKRTLAFSGNGWPTWMNPATEWA
jgi:hypothetical protein